METSTIGKTLILLGTAAAGLALATATPAQGEKTAGRDLGGVTLGKLDFAFFDDDTIYVNGQRKSIEQLSPAERAQLRTEIRRSQQDIARERARLPMELAALQRDAARARNGQLRAEIERDRADLRRDLVEVEQEAADMRAQGEDPDRRAAELRNDLREAEARNIDKEVREAIAEADPARITAELRHDEEQMARMLAKLEKLERR